MVNIVLILIVLKAQILSGKRWKQHFQVSKFQNFLGGGSMPPDPPLWHSKSSLPPTFPVGTSTSKLIRDLKIWGRHPSRTPPEVRFRIKRSLRMSVREWDGVSHVVSTPFFSFRVVNKTWVCFCFWSSNYPFLSPFSLSFCIIYC